MFWFLLRLAAGLFVLSRRRGAIAGAIGVMALPPGLRPAALAMQPVGSFVGRVLASALRVARAWSGRR